MRVTYFILFLLVLLTPDLARASDINVHVDYAFSEYRVSPDPGPKRGRAHIDFVMHSNGAIEDHFRGPGGRYPASFTSNNKMGDRKFQVINSNTITRRTKILLTTITVTGTSCQANIRVMQSEYRATSTELGVPANYRDFKILETSCRIE